MEAVLHFIRDHGIPAMFLMILLEYACFPVSSEIVLPFAGAVAAARNTPFLVILLLSSVAGIIGTSICYLIGYFGGERLLHRITIRFPKSKKPMEASLARFEKFGSYIVCIGRIIPIIRTYIAFIAGSMRQPYPIFFLFSTIGITIWNCLLIGIGYFLRENWTHAISYYSRYKNIIIPILLILILLLIARRIHKRAEIQIQEYRDFGK